MTISYTGKLDLIPDQTKKIENRYAKIGKLLEANGKGDRQAHVILQHSRGQHKVEITLNYLDQSLIGASSDGEQFTALLNAVDRLEKQILKVRDKRRASGKSISKEELVTEPLDDDAAAIAAIVPPSGNGAKRPQVFRVMPAEYKPMTVEEAMLEIEKDGDYYVYTDARSSRLSVLLKRGDGNFDLVEC